MNPPCVLFEDPHLLAVHKPAGMNTHAPAPYAGEGIYEWLKNRESRWSNLAILHRLDKETSGVLVFGKTPLANRSLTGQFTRREIRKRYQLVTAGRGPAAELRVCSQLARSGEIYRSIRSAAPSPASAETLFRPSAEPIPDLWDSLARPARLVEAEPLTGRTHQIRAHAAERGFPVLGDVAYGGTPATRVYLHAAELQFRHPATGEALRICAPARFADDPRQLLRELLIDRLETSAFRRLHGASDGSAGLYADFFGDFLLAESEREPDATQRRLLSDLRRKCRCQAVYHKLLSRDAARRRPEQLSPRLLEGSPAQGPFAIRENDLHFEISFAEGYSVGLFLDQRDNRRRLLTRRVAADFRLLERAPSGGLEALNTFAYTCGFSVCAAKSGFRVTSLDLSRKYLAWGRRNYALNQIEPDGHDFIYGDVFDWLARFRRKARLFDLVLLDPPTFSKSRESGVFRAEMDYPKLLRAALAVLRSPGVLFASSNAASWDAAGFVQSARAIIAGAGRQIRRAHFGPQPPDFPISKAEPAYLKTLWLELE